MLQHMCYLAEGNILVLMQIVTTRMGSGAGGFRKRLKLSSVWLMGGLIFFYLTTGWILQKKSGVVDDCSKNKIFQGNFFKFGWTTT